MEDVCMHMHILVYEKNNWDFENIEVLTTFAYYEWHIKKT